MRPTLTVSSATALTEANAMNAPAINLHHIGLSSHQFESAVSLDRDTLPLERDVRQSSAEEPDHRHPRLLRAHRERPRNRAAEQRDELAPLHLPAHSITSS